MSALSDVYEAVVDWRRGHRGDPEKVTISTEMWAKIARETETVASLPHPNANKVFGCPFEVRADVKGVEVS